MLRTSLRVVRVPTELGSRLSLAEQIPALVELLLEIPQSGGPLWTAFAGANVVLLGNESVDPFQNRLVFHRCLRLLVLVVQPLSAA